MFTSSHSVHALATYLPTVCENMQKQVCQLDECKSMHVGQSKRMIGREPFMRLGGLVGSLGCLLPITDLRIQPLCPLQLRIPHSCKSARVTCGPFSPVLRLNMDAHLQGSAALHAPLPYKQHMDRISLILGCRRVIMFLCASPAFLPSLPGTGRHTDLRVKLPPAFPMKVIMNYMI